MNTDGRNGVFDFIKASAAVLIVLHHYQQITGIYFQNGINFYNGYVSWGYLVELFFIISGIFTYKYIYAIKDKSINIREWYIKRAMRLLPLNAISAAVYTLAISYYQKMNVEYRFYLFKENTTFIDFLVTALGLQEGYGFDVSKPNSPLWYISVLITCSMIFYLITRLAVKLKVNPHVFYALMVVAGIVIYATQTNTVLMTYNTSRGYYSFFTGVLLASAEKTIRNNRLLFVASGFVIAAFAAVFVVKPDSFVPFANFWLTFALYPAIMIWGYNTKISKWFKGKIWNIASAISFSVYVWHVPLLLIIFILTDLYNIRIVFASKLIILTYLAVSILFGAISYYIIEKPLNKFIFAKNKKSAE